MNTKHIRHVGITLALALVGACTDEEGAEAETTEAAGAQAAPTPAAAAPSAPAAEGAAGQLSVNYPFIGFTETEVTLATALAYPREDGLRIIMVGEGLGDVGCDHDWNLGRDMEEEQLAVAVDTHGMRHDVPYAGEPGTLENVGYTYYYRRAGHPQGTNSGNDAAPDLDTELTLTRVDDAVIEGTVRLRDQVEGRFTARVCD